METKKRVQTSSEKTKLSIRRSAKFLVLQNFQTVLNLPFRFWEEAEVRSIITPDTSLRYRCFSVKSRQNWMQSKSIITFFIFRKNQNHLHNLILNTRFLEMSQNFETPKIQHLGKEFMLKSEGNTIKPRKTTNISHKKKRLFQKSLVYL